MDNHETEDLQGSTQSSEETLGEGSTIELKKIREVLAVKMKADSHYSSKSSLGKGSFGEVMRTTDTLLGREVAMKSIKPTFREQDEVVDRFLKEARATAQLEHPNIMPVHELGVNEEQGIYFTMKKIEGEDLKQILESLHCGVPIDLEKYPIAVLLEIFLSVCNGVAFAHSQDVIHRDLKPANIMIGAYGEVLILDWGLVKKLGGEDDAMGAVKLRMDEFDTGANTMDGAISGTPNYMSPEQAEGRIDDIDFRSDVYSLGAILYHILTYLPPFEKTKLSVLLKNVRTGKFMPPRERRPELNIPRELNAICLKAMSLDPINRYSSVERLAKDIRNYRSNRDVVAYKAPGHIRFWKTCKRNPIKACVIAAALLALFFAFGFQRVAMRINYNSNMAYAKEFRESAREKIQVAKGQYDRLQRIRETAQRVGESPEEVALRKALENSVGDVKQDLNLAQGFYEIIAKPLKRKASFRKGLLDVIYQRIDFSLYRKEYEEVASRLGEVDVRLKYWGDVVLSPDTVAFFDHARNQVRGDGQLLISGGAGVAELMIFSVDEHDPRFTHGDMIARAGSFPYTNSPILKGSYLMEVVLENGTKIPYPLFIEHGENEKVSMDIPSEIPIGMAYVPEGSFFYGGPESRFFREHRRPLDGFFIKQFEVTFSEYIPFWKSLDKQQKQNCQSRIQLVKNERKFHDAWDAAGNLRDGLTPDLPVIGVTREAAEAYCAWLSVQKGAVIRLPSAEEWEKAARGVDGRRYVWGNGFDGKLTLTKKNMRAKEKYPLFAPPGSFRSSDCSIYNVYDMAGNVREMTSSQLPDSGVENVLYQIKGGSAFTTEAFLPCCYASDTPVVPSDVGFRYVQELAK